MDPGFACLMKIREYILFNSVHLKLTCTFYSAEFMLDVIGAGATATSKVDWRQKWLDSAECHGLQADIDRIHSEGRRRPAVAATMHSDFATSWLFQCRLLLMRNLTSYWRDPSYLLAKLVLNIFGGLFIGFTFWNSKDTLQGTQNKLFVGPPLFTACMLMEFNFYYFSVDFYANHLECSPWRPTTSAIYQPT
jgi:hypothetical protein